MFGIEGKAYIINSDVCDTRKMAEDAFEGYAQIILNADVLLTNERSRAILARYPVVMNSDVTFDTEEELAVSTQNGKFTLHPGQVPQTPTLLVVNGCMTIEPGCDLHAYRKIVVNGVVICPQSLTGSLGDVSVNGVVESYPDDCIVLDSIFVPDRVFVLRAKENARYYVRKKVMLTAKDIDVSALAQKGVQFVTPELVCTESDTETAVSLVGEQAKLTVVPDGCTYVDKDVTLDRRLLKKYGGILYIDGDLTLDEESAPFLESLSYVYVTGTVMLPASLAEAFDEVDGVFDEIEVLSGSVVQNKVTVRLTPSMLASSSDGLTIRNCAHVQVDELITPEELEQANLTIENCAQISCTPKQRGAIELASRNVASISDEATSIADMFKGVLGSKVVNADHYVL